MSTPERDPADVAAQARRAGRDPARAEATRCLRVLEVPQPEDETQQTAWSLAREEAQARLDRWREERTAEKRARRAQTPQEGHTTPPQG